MFKRITNLRLFNFKFPIIKLKNNSFASTYIIGALITCLTVIIGVRLNTHFEKEKKKCQEGKKKIKFLCRYYSSETQTTIGLFLGTFLSTLVIYMLLDLVFGTIYLNTYNSK